ncbi:MAG TPA: (Fe-S)-binding protein [Methylomirabilota bacterium]|nr:(Fe-S)-binding protein [Methylomirabilota bacterium]
MSPSHQWYGALPGWLPFYALIAVAVFLFARRAIFLIRLMRTGRPVARWDKIPARLLAVLVNVLGQARLVLGDFWPGIMHATIFWGFIILTLGSIEFFGKGITERFSLPLLSDTPGYLILQDTFSVAVIAAVAYAAFRRLVTKPRRLTLSPEGLLILVLIFGLMVTDLVADAGRILLAPAPSDRWQFAGRAVAGLLASLPDAGVRGIFHVSWWTHAVLLLGFLVYLPYSKHLHIMAAPFNVFFAPQTPKGHFSTPDLEQAESFGVGTLTEFTWKDLFDTYNCTECGRCTSACPANVSGKELDPKWLILHLQERLLESDPVLLGAKGSAPGEKALVGNVIHDNVLWACTTCRWCVDACPVFIEHVPKIVDMRRWLVLTESRFPAELQPAFRNLENNGNPWQMSWQTRTDWAKDLGVRLMSDVSQAEYLYWVGCYGSFDERNKKVARAFVKLLQVAEVDFAILGNEEKCTGEPARRLGHEYLYQTLAQGNIETLKRYRFQTIVTACPHCFNTIRNEYPDFDGHFRVIHHSQLLDDLVRSGRLRPARATSARITYHDACNLGRYNDVYEEPRRVLASATRDLVEMRLSRSKGFCCGGGGGRVWLEENEGRRVNQLRVEQAMEVNPDILASACPFCLTMFEDGVKGKEVADRIKTRDIAEVLAESLE